MMETAIHCSDQSSEQPERNVVTDIAATERVLPASCLPLPNDDSNSNSTFQNNTKTTDQDAATTAASGDATPTDMLLYSSVAEENVVEKTTASCAQQQQQQQQQYFPTVDGGTDITEEVARAGKSGCFVIVEHPSMEGGNVHMKNIRVADEVLDDNNEIMDGDDDDDDAKNNEARPTHDDKVTQDDENDHHNDPNYSPTSTNASSRGLFGTTGGITAEKGSCLLADHPSLEDGRVLDDMMDSNNEIVDGEGTKKDEARTNHDEVMEDDDDNNRRLTSKPSPATSKYTTLRSLIGRTVYITRGYGVGIATKVAGTGKGGYLIVDHPSMEGRFVHRRNVRVLKEPVDDNDEMIDGNNTKNERADGTREKDSDDDDDDDRHVSPRPPASNGRRSKSLVGKTVYITVGGGAGNSGKVVGTGRGGYLIVDHPSLEGRFVHRRNVQVFDELLDDNDAINDDGDKKDDQMHEKDDQMQEKDDQMQEKDDQMQEKDDQMQEKDDQMQEKDDQMQDVPDEDWEKDDDHRQGLTSARITDHSRMLIGTTVYIKTGNSVGIEGKVIGTGRGGYLILDHPLMEGKYVRKSSVRVVKEAPDDIDEPIQGGDNKNDHGRDDDDEVEKDNDLSFDPNPQPAATNDTSHSLIGKTVYITVGYGAGIAGKVVGRGKGGYLIVDHPSMEGKQVHRRSVRVMDFPVGTDETTIKNSLLSQPTANPIRREPEPVTPGSIAHLVLLKLGMNPKMANNPNEEEPLLVANCSDADSPETNLDENDDTRQDGADSISKLDGRNHENSTCSNEVAGLAGDHTSTTNAKAEEINDQQDCLVAVSNQTELGRNISDTSEVIPCDIIDTSIAAGMPYVKLNDSRGRILPPIVLEGIQSELPMSLSHLPPEGRVDVFNLRTGKVMSGNESVAVRDLPELLQYAEFEPVIPPPPEPSLHEGDSSLSACVPYVRMGRSGPNIRIFSEVMPQELPSKPSDNQGVLMTQGPFCGSIGFITHRFPNGWYQVETMKDGLTYKFIANAQQIELICEPRSRKRPFPSRKHGSRTNNRPHQTP